MRRAITWLALFAIATILPSLSRGEEPDLTKLACPSTLDGHSARTFRRAHEVAAVGDENPGAVATNQLRIVGRSDIDAATYTWDEES